jgi:hypothetical protein
MIKYPYFGEFNMKRTFSTYTAAFATVLFLASCSSTPPKEDGATQRVNRIVESVREATTFGFVDVTIEYLKPDLYVSGHTYNAAHISRLMRAGTIDRFSDLRLINSHPKLIQGRKVVSFVMAHSNVGNAIQWNGPIFLKFPLSPSEAEISGDMLHLYSVNEFVFIGALGSGEEQKAAIRSKDGLIYRLRIGQTLGREQAVLREISDTSIVLAEPSGTSHELRLPSNASN